MKNITVQQAGSEAAPSSSSALVTADSLFSRNIQFQPSTKHYGGYRNSGDFRIETLNPAPTRKPVFSRSDIPKRADGSDLVENGLDPELTLGITFRRIGAGLENLGNTCFLNSVLQCLTYTEPLAAYLQSGKHQNSCHVAGFCALCAIQKHVTRALQSTGRSLVPKDLVSNLRCISRNFRNARQEDAHEYMVSLLESMHKCCLPSGVPSESPAAYEKSLVHKIFGGRLCSQVECQQCHYCSNKFDPFLDLSLEIFRADTLNVALRNFTAAEMLDGGEKHYQCQRCKQKVKAKKRLTVHKAPYVLTIHLKRFHSHDPGRKVDKKVSFDQTLDMKPFVSVGSYEGELKYSLYGVLVHYGHNTHSGHYVCFVRTSSGMWYLLNDNQVHQVSEKHVLEQKAYMLFYVCDRKNAAPKKTPDAVQKENIKATVSGNIANVASKQLSNGYLENGSVGNRSSILCSSANLNQKDAKSIVNLKDAASSGILKEKPRKDSLLLQNNKILMPGCFVSKVQPSVEASLNVQLLKDVPKEQTRPNQDFGEGFPPLASTLNSKNDSPKLENISDMNGTKTCASSRQSTTSCNVAQNSATLVANVTSENIDPVLNIGTLTEVLSEDSSNKAVGKVPRPSHMAPVNSASKTKSENCQAGGIHNENAAGNSPSHKIDDGCQSTVHKLADSSTSCVLLKECQGKAADHKPHRKPKCKLLKFWLFRASLGLRKKKKHRKSKRRSCATQNLIKEQLLDSDYLSTELGPSTSGESLRTCSLYLQSKETKSGSRSGDSVKKSSRHSLLDVVDGEFKERSNKNGSVLATNEKIIRSSNPTAGKKQPGAQGIKCCESSEGDALQVGTTGTFTTALEETTVSRWDGMELLPSPSCGMHYEENVSIGYVPDEWDEEYDRGKRKKPRRNMHNFGGSNPFQEIATKKTQFQKAKMDQSRSGNQPFRI